MMTDFAAPLPILARYAVMVDVGYIYAAAGDDADAERARLVTEYEDTLANPYIAAERGYVDAVIRPAETRAQVVRALRALRNKRASLPPKKHGNIPL